MAPEQQSRGDSAHAWDGVWREVAHVDGGDLGQYAALLQRSGPEIATVAFPAVSAHLSSRCRVCADDLERVLAFLAEDCNSGSAG